MADRLTPPMRYPRYGEESSDNHSSGKKREKSGNSREVFHKSKLSVRRF